MSEVNFHYSYILNCLDTKEENFFNNSIVKLKCFVSFCQSIKYTKKHFPESKHTVGIFYSSENNQDLLDSIKLIISKLFNSEISFEFIELSEKLNNENFYFFKQGFDWLQKNGKQFVFNIYDNYLFKESAIYDMFLISNQVKFSTGYDIITTPSNEFELWLIVHGNSDKEKFMSIGQSTWYPYYNITNSFMTTHKRFCECFDIYEKFYENNDLRESHFNSLFSFLITNNNYGFVPVYKLAFLISNDVDIFTDQSFKTLWNNIDVTLPTT